MLTHLTLCCDKNEIYKLGDMNKTDPLTKQDILDNKEIFHITPVEGKIICKYLFHA
jgi:hypothetical protein